MFRFGGIKGIQKCIDKIDIAYGGDVSLLLDVCRERVVFENLSDLTRALAELSKDPTVSLATPPSRQTNHGHHVWWQNSRPKNALVNPHNL